MQLPSLVCRVALFVAWLAGAIPAMGAEVVVDNDAGGPAYSESGTWITGSSTGYSGGTYRTASAYPIQPASSATWRPTIPEDGKYGVYAVYRQSTNRTTSAPVTISCDSGTTTLYLNQNGANLMVETLLGEFTFKAGTAGFVRMDNTGATGAYIADAMIWRTVVDTPPVISGVMREPMEVDELEPVAVIARVSDDNAVSSVSLNYQVSPSGLSATIITYDDGNHGDLAAGDGVYGAEIPAQPKYSMIRYYWAAADDAGHVSTSSPQFYEAGHLPANSADIVVQDDDGAPLYTETGTWTLSSSTGYLGSTYRYAAAVSGAPTKSATWQPEITSGGLYRVYAAFARGSNRTTSAPLTITHSMGTTSVYVDQSGASETAEVLLGEFPFEVGTSGSVRMDNNGAAGVHIADAMIWRVLSDPAPVISHVTRAPRIPTQSDCVVVTATVSDNASVSSVSLCYSVGAGGSWISVSAADDGTHGDGLPGDGIFGATIPPQSSGTPVAVTIAATDAAGNTTVSPRQDYVVGNTSTGTVLVVLSSDTSVWGFTGGYHSTIPWAVFTSRRGVLSRLYEDSFRQSITDSYGTPFKVTWFMHGGAWFLPATNSTPISPIHYIRANWGDGISRYDDTLEYHFHHYNWDGTDWVQASTFTERIWEYEWVMSEMMLEENLFIAAFRSGWNYMDDPYQQYLERWVPFRMEGVQTNWIPYHPSTSNWKQSGAMKGWETRHIYMKSFSKSVANAAFSQALAGNDQVLCIWSHQNENDYPDQIRAVDSVLHTAAAAYPAVPFRYCSAREAMRAWLKHEQGNMPPPLEVVADVLDDDVTVSINTADDIYQEQPWVAAREHTGRCVRLDAAKTGTGKWQASYSRTQFDRVAVGVCDLYGNDALVEVDDHTRCWTTQADFAEAKPVNVDIDTSPVCVQLAQSFGMYKGSGSLQFDAMAPTGAIWKSVALVGTTADGATIRYRFKTATGLSALDSAPWSEYYPSGASQLPQGLTEPWIRVEVLLEGTPSVTPRLDSVEISYDMPSSGFQRCEFLKF